MIDVDDVINDPDKVASLDEREIEECLERVIPILEKEKALVKLDGDVAFVGDTHGDFDTTAFSSSGTDVKVKHTWSTQGIYIIKATAEDTNGLVGPEGTLSVSMPRNRATQRPFLNFLENHPILYQLLLRFLRL